MLCDTWVDGFFTFSLLAFDIAMKGMTGISEVREYFGFLYNKKYFCVISMVGVFDRGLSSDKQPVNAACKGCSDLSQQELPGEEKHGWKESEKHKAFATSHSFGNGVCVSETTAWSAV